MKKDSQSQNRAMLTNIQDVVIFFVGDRSPVPYPLTRLILLMSGHLRYGPHSVHWSI